MTDFVLRRVTTLPHDQHSYRLGTALFHSSGRFQQSLNDVRPKNDRGRRNNL
jgi:hypothetical protein